MYNNKLGTGWRVKGYRDMEEVHYGDEGPHWAVVSMKKKKKIYTQGLFLNKIQVNEKYW